MQHDPLLVVFIVLSSIAILVLAVVGVVVAMAVLDLHKQAKRLFQALDEHARPLLATSRQVMDDLAPKLRVISTNVMEISTTAKAETAHLAVALDGIVDKVQLQTEHAMRVTNNTLNAVDSAREQVASIVDAPLRIAHGVVAGVAAALNRFFSRNERGVDEIVVESDLYE